MGSLWASLFIKDDTAKGVNSALARLKQVDGAISKMYEELLKKQKQLARESGKKVQNADAIRSLREEIKALELGTKNALAYKTMVASLEKELSDIQTLKNINVGVDKSKLAEAEGLIKAFQKDLERTTMKSLGGLDTNTWMANFKKDWSIVQRQVKQLTDSFKKDNALTDSATWEARLTKSLERVKQKMLDLKAQMREGYRLGLDTTPLLTAYNRLNAVLRRGTATDKNGSLLVTQSEAAFLKILSDIGVASAKAATDVKRYADAKNQAAEASKRQSAAEKQAAQAQREAAQAANQLASAFNRVHNSASKSSQVLSDIKSLFLQGGIVFGAQQFARSIIQTGGDIVQQHIALRSILGDIQKADALFAQTQQLALQSPFTFQELNRDVKQLAAFGVDTDRLYDTTKRLADVASGLGVSFERLGLAYGQVKARSWLDGKELRQFAYAGLPMLQKIADLYNETGKNGRRNYTTGDVRTMITKRQVSFEDVDEVFKRLTDAGGQFYNLQFVLSETLLGRWNKLLDAWSIMLGRFADGNNIIGQVFMTAINGATEFVLQLDRISPLLLSFGTMFAGSKIFGAAQAAMGVGVSNIVKQMQLAQTAQLKQYATTQMQQAAEGKITAQVAEQNILKQRQLMSSMEVRNLTYAQLLSEGKISNIQLAQLLRRGQISEALINQLRLMGLISAEEEKLILQTQREGLLRRSVTYGQLGAGNIANKLGGFFTAGNLAMIGASVGLALWMGYKQWSDKVDESIKSLQESAKQSASNYSSFLSGLGAKGSGNALQKQVDSMKEILETSGDYTDTIKAQIDGAKTLSAQYDILKKNIEAMAKSNTMMSGAQGAALGRALSATGLQNDFLLSAFGIGTPRWLGWLNGLDNDSLETNVNDATESLQKYQLMFDQLDANTQKSMEKFIQNLASKNEKLSSMIQGLPISEQIRVLAFTGGDDWEAFVERFSNGSEEVTRWMSDLADRAKKSSDDVSEIMYDDVPKMLESLRNDMGLSQDSFRQWAAKNPEIFASMMDEMARKANITSQQILTWFHRAISELMGFNYWMDNYQPGNAPKTYKNGLTGMPILSIRQALRGNGTMVIGKNVGEYDKKLRKVQDETWEKTAQNIQKEYKDARNEYDQINAFIKKGVGVTPAVSARAGSLRYQLTQWENIANAAGVTLDVGKNKTTGNYGKNGNGSQVDQELRAWRKEASSIQSYYDTWDKWRKVEGDVAARQRVANDSRFSEEFRRKYSDPSELAKNYESLAGTINKVANSEDRRQYVQELRAKAAERDAQIEYENAQRLINIFKEQLDLLSKRYEIYEKLARVAGREAAAAFAFGPNSHSESYYKYLQERVGSYNFTDKKGKHYSVEEVMGMYDEDVLTKFGSEAQHLVKELKTQRNKLDGEIADSLEKGYEYFEDYEAQIDAINKKYDEQIKRLKERNGLNKDNADYIDDKTLQRSTTVINQQRGREIAVEIWKDFQKSRTYTRYFASSVLLSTQQAEAFGDVIKRKLTEAFKAGALTADEYSAKLKEIEDTMNEVSNRRSDAFNYFFGGGIDKVLQDRKTRGDAMQVQGAQDEQKAWQQLRQATALGDKAGMADAKNALAAAEDMQAAGSAMSAGAGQAAGTVAMIDTIVHGINDNVQKLKSLLEDIANSIGIFKGEEAAEDFRTSRGYTFFSAFSSASQGATDAWDSLKSGNVMGVVEGMYRSFSGWIEPWASRHNAKLDKQIRLAERQIKAIENLQSSIERTLENTLGGVYAYQSKNSTSDAIREGLDNYSLATTGARWGGNTLMRDTLIGNAIGTVLGGPITGAIIGSLFGHGKHKYTTNYTEDTYESMARADQTRAYYDQMLASYKMQRDNLQAQLDAEEKKKGTDKDKVQDYESQIDELDDKISAFAKDMAKSLYDIDVKSWAKDLTDAVVSAWAAGEDAVEAYRDKVKDLMRDLATNIITQKIMEQALQPVEDYIEEMMDEQSGKLDENNIVRIADMLDSLGNDAVDDIVSLMEKLKDKGWDLSDTDSSTMSSSIKGITENTADVLAAYLNAIRADVSVIRQLDGIYLPKLDITATAQLQQLNMISANTLRNADAAERIEVSVNNLADMFNKAQNNTKPLYVYAK